VYAQAGDGVQGRVFKCQVGSFTFPFAFVNYFRLCYQKPTHSQTFISSIPSFSFFPQGPLVGSVLFQNVSGLQSASHKALTANLAQRHARAPKLKTTTQVSVCL
jgi:hypothetical protein